MTVWSAYDAEFSRHVGCFDQAQEKDMTKGDLEITIDGDLQGDRALSLARRVPLAELADAGHVVLSMHRVGAAVAPRKAPIPSVISSVESSVDSR